MRGETGIKGVKTMRKFEVNVPENVEMADIQSIQTRIKKA